MHQDVFAKVLCGQAEVDEGVAKPQRLRQLKEGEVVVGVSSAETVVEVHRRHANEPLLVA